MGNKSSRQFDNNSFITPPPDETKTANPVIEKKENTLQSVEYNIGGGQFSNYNYLLESFFKGFFLNDDLQCAYVRNCAASFWNIYELTEKANTNVKYRIFKTTNGKESGWGVVKSECENNLNRVGIVRSEMEIDVYDDVFYSRKELFQKQLTLFYKDFDYKTLKLKKVNTTEFSKLKEILNEMSKLHPDVDVKTKTVVCGENSQQFNYILTKQHQLLPEKQDYFAK